jgi:hypothetical protein
MFENYTHRSFLVGTILMIRLLTATDAKGGSYQGNPGGFSFTITSSCDNFNIIISNISIQITNRTSASISFTATYNAGGNSYDFSDNGTISGGRVVFDESSFYSFCNSNPGATRGWLQPTISGINFTGGSTLSFNLVIAATGHWSGSSGTKAVSVSFVPSINPTLSISTTSVCAGTQIQISGYGGSPSGASLYANGSFIGTLASNNNFDITGTQPYTIPVGTADNQTIQIRLTTTVPSINDYETIYVGAPLPSSLAITANKTLPLCTVEPITLSINNPANSTVLWSNGMTTASNLINNPSSGEYNVRVQKRINGVNVCPAVTKTIDVQIFNFTPSISLPPATTKCQGEDISLSAEPGGSFSYEWKRGTTVAGTTQTIPAKEAGSYTVTVKPTGNSCPAKTSTAVDLNFDTPFEDKEIVSSNPKNIICGDPGATSIDLTAQPAGVSYSWQREGGGFSGSTQSVTVTQKGKYMVNMSRGACQRTKSIEIQDNVFDPDIVPVPAAYCSDTPLTLTAKSNDAARFDYEWKRNGTIIGANAPTVALSSEAGTFKYTMKITAKNAGCQPKNAHELTIRTDTQIKNPRITPNPAIICNKASGLTLTALSDSSAGVTFQWSGGGSVGGDPGKYIVSNGGTYTVTFTRGACKSTASVSPKEEELVVTVTAPTPSNPLLLCSGAAGVPIELKAVSNLSTASIQWMRDGSAAPGANTGATYTPTQSGQYYATADFDGICKATSTQKITTEALSNFTAAITPANPAAVCDDRSILLSSSVSEPKYLAQYLYEWVQDTTVVNTGTGSAHSTLNTGKIIHYEGNSLVTRYEANFVLKVSKDGCKATSPVSKVALKPGRSGIIVLDYNTLEATESIDKKYQWFYKAGPASSLSDTVGYTAITTATQQRIIGADLGSYIVRANRNDCGTKFSFPYVVDQITATAPVLSQEWKIYPNPTMDALFIGGKSGQQRGATVEIWNISGQSVLKDVLRNAVESYSLGPFPAGIYILEIRQGNEKVVRKIVKQ